MKKVLTILGMTAVFLGSVLAAQQQTQTELPTYTVEQKWNRAAGQLTVMFVGGISYAKSMGQSAEQFGDYLADLFVSSWGEPGSGTLNVIRGVNMNFRMWPDSEIEITDSSDKSVTVRANRPYARYFGENESWYGVTLDEFESCMHVFNVRLAEHLGLGFKDEIKDGWIYMTFSIDR